MTELMKAVKQNDAAAVGELIRRGANVNEPDASQDFPLIIAAYQGRTQIVKLLLEAGADVSVVDPGMKATALHAAAYAGQAAAARLLIQHGIDIDKQGPHNGYTALHDAVWQNHAEVVQVLLEAGANVHLTAKSGETPLAFARAKKHREIAALIENAAAGGRHLSRP